MRKNPALGEKRFYVLRIIGACLVAVVGATLLFAFITFVPWTSGKPLSELPLFVPIWLVGSVLVLGLTLAVIPAVAIAEWRSIRAWPFYAVAGGLVGLWWWPLSVPWEYGPYEQPDGGMVAVASVLAGMVGGMIYWRLAGRMSGSWKQTVTSKPRTEGR